MTTQDSLAAVAFASDFEKICDDKTLVCLADQDSMLVVLHDDSLSQQNREALLSRDVECIVWIESKPSVPSANQYVLLAETFAELFPLSQVSYRNFITLAAQTVVRKHPLTITTTVRLHGHSCLNFLAAPFLNLITVKG